MTDFTGHTEREPAHKLFRALLDQASDAVEIIDPATARILDCNEHAYRDLGYTRPEFLALTIPDLDPQTTIDQWRERFSLLPEGDRPPLTSVRRRKNGTTFPIEVRHRVVHADRPYVLAVVQDLTATTMSATAAHPSNRHCASLIENLHGVVWEADADSLAFRFVSPYAETLLGYPARQWTEDPLFWRHHIHPDDRDATISHYLAAANGQAHSIEYRMIAADERTVWVHDVATVANDQQLPKTLRGVIVDITGRKRTEQALQTLVRGTAAAVGAEFFPHLVRHLAHALDVTHAFIAEVAPHDRSHARTLAVWTYNQPGEPFEYDLAHTPCANVLAQGLCSYPEQVQKLFPQDKALQIMAAESYMGIPLWASSGEQLGLLAILDVKPFGAQQTRDTLLTIFAARAAAELERIRIERALREFYDITASATRPFEAQVEAVLDIGQRHFGCQIGLLTRALGTYAELMIVRDATATIPKGTLIRLEGSPCSAAIAQQKLLEVRLLGHSPYAQYAPHADLGAKSYFGTAVYVHGRPYGTVCFLNEDRSPVPFTESDKTLLQLMARWVGTALEREEAVKALRDGKERTSAILNAALDGIITIDAEDRILEFNPAAEAIFEHPRHTALGRRVADLIIPTAFQEHHQRGLASCLAAGDAPLLNRRLEVTALRADGTEFPVELSLARVRGQHPPIFTAFVRDISARKQAETELQESESRLRQLAESITEVFWLTTPDKQTMLYISPAYETLWGRSCESLYRNPESWLEAVHPEERPRIASLVRIAQANGSYCEQFRIIRPDGTVRWILDRAFPIRDSSGQVTRIAGVAWDITDRVATETSLRNSEARLKEAQRIAGVGSWEWDLATGTTFWSDETYRLFGYQPRSITPTFEIIVNALHPDDRDGVRQALAATLEHNIPYDHIARIPRPSGEIRILHCRGELTRDHESTPLRLTGTTEDVTEQIRSEDQLRHAYRQLQEVTRHAAAAEENERRRIARKIHDELGQSLTAMRFQLSAMKQPRTSPVAQVQPTDHNARLDELLALTESMLGQVQYMSTSLRPYMLDELGLIPAVQAHARQFEIQTGIACDVVADPAIVDYSFNESTSSSVFRIVQELLTNVLRHAQAMAITITFAQDGQMLTLTVQDNGTGIGTGTESSPDSYGLKGVIERAALLGGNFAIRRNTGSGTVATLRVPLVALSPASPGAP